MGENSGPNRFGDGFTDLRNWCPSRFGGDPMSDHCLQSPAGSRGPACRNKVVEYIPKRSGGEFPVCRKHADKWREHILESFRDLVWALNGEVHGV